MITPKQGVARVTLSLDPADVQLLDRLAAVEGGNRSAVMRSILLELRPSLEATVSAFEAAMSTRDQLMRSAAALPDELELLRVEAEKIQAAYLGAMSRFEGAAAAAAASDPRSGRHGGHTPTPTDEPST